MADFLNDGEFWLPPKFLADDEAFIDRPYAASPFASDIGSPVDSAETESDEDDLLADLSRKMTRSALENSGYGGSVRFPTGSPQSTLRPATWDLLCEAATEVAKMRLAEEMYGRRAPVSIPGKPLNTDNTLRYAQNSVPYHLLLDYQIQQFKRQQMMKQHLHRQQQQRSDGGGWAVNQKPNNFPYAAAKTCGAAQKSDFPESRNGRQVGLSPTAWPSLQQAAQPSSGMRPVFLGPPAGKRECAGTGVFLPRHAGPQPPEPRKKPACSTAPLPNKAVHAQNTETMAPLHLHRFNGGDVAWNVRRNAQQNRSIPAQPKPSSEIQLPQEWTY